MCIGLNARFELDQAPGVRVLSSIAQACKPQTRSASWIVVVPVVLTAGCRCSRCTGLPNPEPLRLTGRHPGTVINVLDAKGLDAPCS